MEVMLTRIVPETPPFINPIVMMAWMQARRAALAMVEVGPTDFDFALDVAEAQESPDFEDCLFFEDQNGNLYVKEETYIDLTIRIDKGDWSLAYPDWN